MNKYKLFCTIESQFKFVWSSTTPTVCPDDEKHDILVDEIMLEDPKDVSYTIEFSTTNTTYSRGGVIIYKGNMCCIPVLSHIKCIANVLDGSAQIRVYDVTNDTVIGESDVFTNLSPGIIDITTITNLPNNEAIFEFQLKKVSGTSDCSLDSVFFYY